MSRVKFIRDGGVAITCSKKQDISNISHTIKEKMKNGYEIKVPEKKNPKIKIINLEKKMIEDHEVLIERIILQNSIKTEL